MFALATSVCRGAAARITASARPCTACHARGSANVGSFMTSRNTRSGSRPASAAASRAQTASSGPTGAEARARRKPRPSNAPSPATAALNAGVGWRSTTAASPASRARRTAAATAARPAPSSSSSSRRSSLTGRRTCPKPADRSSRRSAGAGPRRQGGDRSPPPPPSSSTDSQWATFTPRRRARSRVGGTQWAASAAATRPYAIPRTTIQQAQPPARGHRARAVRARATVAAEARSGATTPNRTSAAAVPGPTGTGHPSFSPSIVGRCAHRPPAAPRVGR